MLPNDPFLLLSYINTKLRDEYSSLADFCEDVSVSREELEEKLSAIGYVYEERGNRFIAK